jgi:hypothetical protein
LGDIEVIFLCKRALASTIILMLLGHTLYTYARPLWVPAYQDLAGERSLQQALEQYGEESQARLLPFFEAAKAPYPPTRITLLAIKDEKKLELWTEEADARFFIRAYPIKAASGIPGPKLREGDRQVPEGIYRLEHLNPNSAYHLSMKIDYPNSFDRQHANREGRTRPGGDIFIHGNAVSIGCLAMGDRVIEELFTLVARTGTANVKVIIAPSDPRQRDILPLADGHPAWVPGLYREITSAFMPYRIFDTAIGHPSDSFMAKCH